MNSHVVLPNPSPLNPTQTWVINHSGNPSNWEISNIEVFADAELTKPVYEDLLMADLPAETQAKILSALHDHDEGKEPERLYTLQEVAAEVRMVTTETMATVARLTAENERLQRENARHRRNGMLRLAADLRKPETLEDIALLRMENAAVERIIEGSQS